MRAQLGFCAGVLPHNPENGGKSRIFTNGNTHVQTHDAVFPGGVKAMTIEGIFFRPLWNGRQIL